MRNIAYIYVGITCICQKFIEYIIFVSNTQVIMPTTILAYLVIHNSFASNVYMYDISNIKFQIHRLR